MRKPLLVVFLAVLILSNCFAFVSVTEAAKPKTWIVSQDGTGDFVAIQPALNAAQSRDTIYVKGGVYYEHLTIAKTISMKGENKETTIIDAQYSEPASVILVSADKVMINGFTIRNARSGGSAIWNDGFNYTMISNNIITNNGDGIRILHSHGNMIENNIITNNPYTALGFNWAYDNLVQGNLIDNNNIGIGGGFEPCYNNIFVENTISNNAAGIQVDFSNCKLYHNNLIDNTVQVSIYTSTFTAIWDNGYPSGGNYWSDYSGADNYRGANQNRNKADGIGDTSYTINAQNVDNYPLMQPFA